MTEPSAESTSESALASAPPAPAPVAPAPSTPEPEATLALQPELALALAPTLSGDSEEAPEAEAADFLLADVSDEDLWLAYELGVVDLSADELAIVEQLPLLELVAALEEMGSI